MEAETHVSKFVELQDGAEENQKPAKDAGAGGGAFHHELENSGDNEDERPEAEKHVSIHQPEVVQKQDRSDRGDCDAGEQSAGGIAHGENAADLPLRLVLLKIHGYVPHSEPAGELERATPRPRRSEDAPLLQSTA